MLKGWRSSMKSPITKLSICLFFLRPKVFWNKRHNILLCLSETPEELATTTCVFSTGWDDNSEALSPTLTSSLPSIVLLVALANGSIMFCRPEVSEPSKVKYTTGCFLFKCVFKFIYLDLYDIRVLQIFHEATSSPTLSKCNHRTLSFWRLFDDIIEVLIIIW